LFVFSWVVGGRCPYPTYTAFRIRRRTPDIKHFVVIVPLLLRAASAVYFRHADNSIHLRHSIRSHPMKLIYALPLMFAVSVTGCTWVKVSEGGEGVAVSKRAP